MRHNRHGRSESRHSRDQRWDLTYDAAGTLVSKQSGGCRLRYRYNLNGDQTEQYWDGAPCGDTKRVSSYDPAGRMTRMETYPAVCGTNQEPCYQPRTFWYDGLGRRILMQADSASSATSSGEQGLWRYWWVDDNVLVKTFNLPNDPEVDWTWPEIRRVSGDTLRTVGEWFFYAPGADNLLGSINPLLAPGRRHLFVRDYRGSVIQTTYETGQALGIGAGAYQPFGGQLDGSSARATEPGYNGHESSGGLVYMRNRWYDPNTGRFTQQDPIGFAGGSNLYGYAGGNPVTYSDPFGLCPEEKKDADGKCPGGLSTEDWDRIKESQKWMKTEARGQIDKLLNTGRITILSVLRVTPAGGMVHPFAPQTILLNPKLLTQDASLIAKILVHESRHLQQFEGRGVVGASFLSLTKHDELELDARIYANQNTYKQLP